MQQRRGTAAQWISTNAGAGPVLNAGEMGWESDTNKFKIGDGVNNWTSLDYFSDINSTVNPAFGSSITFEGATANDFETTLAITDPTADRTITIPDVTGTVITTGNLSDITNIGVFTSTITMEGSTANDFELTLSAGDPTADRTLTFPDATDTLVGRATTDTLTNKSISLGSNTVTSTLAQLNTAVSDADVASLAGTETLTNKTVALGSNTVSGTIAQFNTAVTDADLATLAGTETLTNKTLTSPKINEDVAVTATATELNYVDGVTSAIQTQLDAKAPLAAPAFTGTATAVNLTISGDLTVNGTTTNINSTSLVVEDKNVVLGDVATPTDITADGGGITLKGATDKTINWIDATDAWTSSEDFNLVTGKVYEINGTSVLSGSTLGSGVTGSSLTSVGTITSGTWNGTTIAVANGGTGITSFGTGVATFLGTPSSANLAAAVTGETGSGSLVFSQTPTLTNAVLSNAILQGPEERLSVSATAATGTIPLDVLTSGILYYTSNASANWTLNVRGSSGTTLNDSLTTNDSITVVFFVTNGETPYYQTGFQIDGSAVTPKWQNGTAPAAGNANSIDIYSYTIVKTGNAAFTAFGSQTKFA